MHSKCGGHYPTWQSSFIPKAFKCCSDYLVGAFLVINNYPQMDDGEV